MDYTVRGILQARILEWVAFSFSRGFSQESYRGLLHRRQILYQLSYEGSPKGIKCKHTINSVILPIKGLFMKYTPCFLNLPLPLLMLNPVLQS